MFKYHRITEHNKDTHDIAQSSLPELTCPAQIKSLYKQLFGLGIKPHALCFEPEFSCAQVHQFQPVQAHDTSSELPPAPRSLRGATRPVFPPWSTRAYGQHGGTFQLLQLPTESWPKSLLAMRDSSSKIPKHNVTIWTIIRRFSVCTPGRALLGDPPASHSLAPHATIRHSPKLSDRWKTNVVHRHPDLVRNR